MTLSENIKELRTAKGLKQADLAKEMSTTVKTISHWETGYCEPSVSQLIMLANFFDISIDELVGRD